MGLYDTKMPYTNLHELNLDWIIDEVKELSDKVDEIQDIEPATALPLEDGTATVGTSVKYAREDHIHPTDSKVTALQTLTATHTEEINSAKSRLDVDEANITTLFNNKQKKLVAGSNIIITTGSDADTISASGEIAVDYPSITNKPQINNVTLVGNQSSSDLNILHTVMLYSDGLQIYDDAEMTNALTFAQVKALLDNEANDVKLWNDNYLLVPEYATTQSGVTAIWFNGTTSLSGKTYLYRITINSDDEVTNDEYQLINKSDIATTSATGLIKVGDRLTITEDGTLSANEQSYTLPTASADTLGGIKVGSRLTITDGVLSAEAGGLTIDLLWTNSSPTSSFSAQTVSIDLSDYELVLIYGFYNCSSQYHNYKTSCITKVGLGGCLSATYTAATDQNYITTRNFITTTNSIEFGRGGYIGTNNNIDDSHSIPYQIYGIK